MITYKKGNLFDNLSEDKKNVILHVCNDAGGFGSGFAGMTAKLYPSVQKAYFELANKGKYNNTLFKLGQVQFVKTKEDSNVVFGNLISQSVPGGHEFNINGQKIYYPPFRPDSFRECMYRVVEKCQGKDLNIMSPLMGCGLAGGSKSVVFGIVEEVIQHYIDITVWEL